MSDDDARNGQNREEMKPQVHESFGLTTDVVFGAADGASVAQPYLLVEEYGLTTMVSLRFLSAMRGSLGKSPGHG